MARIVLLTVTRVDEVQWTIESFSEDRAVLVRQGKGNANFIKFGSGSIPFQLTHGGIK